MGVDVRHVLFLVGEAFFRCAVEISTHAGDRILSGSAWCTFDVLNFYLLLSAVI